MKESPQMRAFLFHPSVKQEPTEGVKPFGLAPVGIPFL